jgi:hypothetical protein
VQRKWHGSAISYQTEGIAEIDQIHKMAEERSGPINLALFTGNGVPAKKRSLPGRVQTISLRAPSSRFHLKAVGFAYT